MDDAEEFADRLNSTKVMRIEHYASANRILAWVLLLTPNLLKMCTVWHFTVFELIERVVAISELVMPSAISLRISASRFDKPING